MKMTKEHYKHIEQAIDAIPVKLRQSHFASLQLDNRVKDIDKRFRWDCFNYAGLTQFACDMLYKYLDDTHIDTALKSIMKGK
jgi:hypothetical protein